ncbi:MAG: M15 family metallopeptidase [Oscillospiraceae bacterium]|nr:M15 family metallopeptidase [Oscillospiraceae bacterium]
MPCKHCGKEFADRTVCINQIMADYRSTGKELRKSPKGLIAGLIALTLLGLCGYGVYRVADGMRKLDSLTVSGSGTEISVPEFSEIAGTEPESKIIYAYESAFSSEVHSGPLMLVNRDFATEDLESGLISMFSKKTDSYGLKDTSLQLLEEPLNAFNAMADAFHKELNGEKLLVTGAYRSKADQRKIYTASLSNKASGAAVAAMAGFSDYETGCSVSLTVMRDGQYLDLGGADCEQERAWFAANAAKYGFILRYPEDKTERTGFPYEAGHYRYVGPVHALYMYGTGLCLEEYLTKLREYTYAAQHLTVPDAHGKAFEIFFVPLEQADTGTVDVPVPTDVPYQRSGNNVDGFVITVETGEDYQPQTE